MIPSAFDYVLFFVIFIFIIKVTRSGFVAEFFSKAAVLLGCIGGVLFYKTLSPYVEETLGIETVPGLVSFLLIFLVLYLIVKTIQRIVGNAFESETMKNLDQALGFFLGIIEGVLVVVLIVIILEYQPFVDTSGLTGNSLLYRFIEPFILSGKDYVLPVLIHEI